MAARSTTKATVDVSSHYLTGTLHINSPPSQLRRSTSYFTLTQYAIGSIPFFRYDIRGRA